MILADSAIWIDHLRGGDALLVERLNRGAIYTHPFVIGEIALGSLARRDVVLSLLLDLPTVTEASAEEVLLFIAQQPLHGLGIGYVDAHLLTSVRLMPGMKLWTRDRRLREAAARLDLVADEAL